MAPKDSDPAPAPRRGRPRDPERFLRIVEAARNHFYVHGLERASVDAIAAEAGVSKMTVYSHFGSKEGLFEAVIKERTDRVMGGSPGVEALDPMQPRKAPSCVRVTKLAPGASSQGAACCGRAGRPNAAAMALRAQSSRMGPDSAGSPDSPAPSAACAAAGSKAKEA